MQEAQSVQVRAAGGPSAGWPVLIQIPGSHCAKEDRIENSLVSAVVLLASLRYASPTSVATQCTSSVGFAKKHTKATHGAVI